MDAPASARRLSLGLNDARAGETSALAQGRGRLSLSVVISLGVDVLILALLLFARHPRLLPESEAQDAPVQHLVWLNQSGPGGGGGGGGNRMKEPPRAAERHGRDRVTVPVAKVPALEPQHAQVEANSVEQLNIPA